MNNKKKCFVIMPFSKAYSLTKEQWTEVFEHKIKPAVEESGFGYKCERYELRRANITKAILQEINSSHLVIADLTSKNPNVLWELGVRHTLSKRTILIAQDKKFLPSDLKDYPIILYKYKQTPAEVDKFKEDIKEELEDIETDPEKPDSPVSDFLENKNIDILAYEKSQNLRKISALISEISFNISFADDLINTVMKNKQVRDAGKEGEGSFPTLRFTNNCLGLLLSYSYVTLPKKWQSTIRGTSNSIAMFNNWLDSWTDKRFTEQVEEKLEKILPEFKDVFINFMGIISEFRTEYTNGNYIEPEVPAICLSEPQHEEYLKLTT